jgi:hypothetical protein
MLVLLKNEAWYDLQLCKKRRLQCNSDGSTFRRLGRKFRDVEFPQWLIKNYESKLHD